MAESTRGAGTKTLPDSCLGADNLVHVVIFASSSGGGSLGHAALALRPVGVLFPSQGTPVTTPSWTTQTKQVLVNVVRRHNGFFEKNRCVYGEDASLWLKVLLNEAVYFNLQPLTRIHREASVLSGTGNAA